MPEFDESLKQRLDHLQSVINRVEGNTFHIKTLCITIVSAAIAFAAANSDSAILVISAAMAVVMIFWSLDTSYLALGRRIRNQYNQDAPFKGDLMERSKKESGFFSVMFSWSVGWFYVAVIVLLIAILAFLLSVNAGCE